MVHGFFLVGDHQRLEFGALIDKRSILGDKCRIVSLQMLINFLQFLDLKHTDLVFLAFFALTANAIRHNLDCLLAQAQVALQHSLLRQVFGLQITENHFELSH